jgi:hypothetical protein
MDTIATLRSFFLWCTVINAVLLAISFVFCAFRQDLIYRLHGRWFRMTRETFVVVLYAFLGGYKIGFILFCLVPYIALTLVG